MKLESLLQYLDGYLRVPDHPDYSTALNGLQVEGCGDVGHVATAVDASQASIEAAVEVGADLLLVHHGLFWGGLQPLTGPLLRRVRPLVTHDVSLYSVHLPLDGHPEIGNSALLARAVGIRTEHRFAAFQGAEIGWYGEAEEPCNALELQDRLAAALGGEVVLIPGGGEPIERAGVVTGAGASFAAEAAALGLDALITGEASHHHYFDAMELGIHLFLGGHYLTETFGVRALGAHLEERFGLRWTFLDQPTGL
ncbi:MAG: Nif3-like dinuclear metal center hexameric protein [Gemmatimonadota bacterium]